MASRHQHVQLPALSPATSKTARHYLEEWGGYCDGVAEGLAAGEDPQEAVRAALALHDYEIAFWDALETGGAVRRAVAGC